MGAYYSLPNRHVSGLLNSEGDYFRNYIVPCDHDDGSIPPLVGDTVNMWNGSPIGLRFIQRPNDDPESAWEHHIGNVRIEVRFQIEHGADAVVDGFGITAMDVGSSGCVYLRTPSNEVHSYEVDPVYEGQRITSEHVFLMEYRFSGHRFPRPFILFQFDTTSDTTAFIGGVIATYEFVPEPTLLDYGHYHPPSYDPGNLPDTTGYFAPQA
jgi:glycosyltransferase involved in cell wall biosynthesis